MPAPRSLIQDAWRRVAQHLYHPFLADIAFQGFYILMRSVCHDLCGKMQWLLENLFRLLVPDTRLASLIVSAVSGKGFVGHHSKVDCRMARCNLDFIA